MTLLVPHNPFSPGQAVPRKGGWRRWFGGMTEPLSAAPALPQSTHRAVQPAPPPPASHLSEKEGRRFSGHGAHYAGCPRSPRSPAFGQGSSLSCRGGIPPVLQCWPGLPCRASCFPGDNSAVGAGGPGNPRAGTAAFDMLPVLGVLGCVCFGLVLPQQLLRCAGDNTLAANWLMLSQSAGHMGC